MIKITTELKQNAGFTSKVSILEITSYTITETVQLVQPTNMPAMTGGGRNIMVNFNLYKSLSDKENGASPYSAIDFPFNYSLQASPEDVIDSAYLYAAVSTKLADAGYNNEVL